MKTNAEHISQIRSMNREIQDDSSVSDRFIYNLLKTKASLLLKRELNQRKLLNSDSIYKPMECLPLIVVNGTECDISKKVARSKEKLPQIDEGLYSYFIQGVFNVDNSRELYFTTIRDYINHSNLRIKTDDSFYTIKNRYLYVLNEDIKSVNIYAYFPEPLENNPCVSMYEREFKFPPYLLDALYELCNQSLINYHKFGTDKEDNNRDEA